MIETNELTRTFGSTTAVDRLTLTISEGEVFGLLGPNGAGKTTTVRMLSGLIGRTSGDATVAGFRLSDLDSARKLRSAIGLLPEEPGLYPDLSAARTLDFYGRLYQVPAALRADRIEKLLTLLGLWDRRDAPARTFSKGMRQRLAIARALIHDPPVPQAQQGQQLLGAVRAQRGGDLVEAAVEVQGPGRGQVRVQPRFLRQEPDRAAQLPGAVLVAEPEARDGGVA